MAAHYCSTRVNTCPCTGVTHFVVGRTRAYVWFRVGWGFFSFLVTDDVT